MRTVCYYTLILQNSKILNSKAQSHCKRVYVDSMSLPLLSKRLTCTSRADKRGTEPWVDSISLSLQK